MQQLSQESLFIPSLELKAKILETRETVRLLDEALSLHRYPDLDTSKTLPSTVMQVPAAMELLNALIFSYTLTLPAQELETQVGQRLLTHATAVVHISETVTDSTSTYPAGIDPDTGARIADEEQQALALGSALFVGNALLVAVQQLAALGSVHYDDIYRESEDLLAFDEHGREIGTFAEPASEWSSVLDPEKFFFRTQSIRHTAYQVLMGQRVAEQHLFSGSIQRRREAHHFFIVAGQQLGSLATHILKTIASE